MNVLSDFLSRHVGVEAWVASLIVIAVVTVIVNQVAQLVLRQAVRATAKTETVWDDALLKSAKRPLLTATWIVGFGFMAGVLQDRFQGSFLEDALVFRNVLLIACVAWFAFRFIGLLSESIVRQGRERGEEFDLTTIDALGKLGRLATLAVAILMIAQTVGFQITGILALGGVGGIAVGFAAKDMLANFFGGLTIYLDRPFGVGDWIRSPDKSIEGTVEHISWRHTRIRAFNKNPIYVPNSVFMSVVVENPSRMSHRRIKETIGLRYDDFARVAPVATEIREMLRQHPAIDKGQTLIVNFTTYGPSSLDIMVYTFTRTTAWADFQAVKQDVLLRIGEIIAGHGAEIAFPTQTLHLQQEAAHAPPDGG